MRRPRWHELALVAGLVARTLRAGKPRPISLEQRLAQLPAQGLPLELPVEIRWNDYAVPSIAAGSERDLAVALGAVHAHLRLAQIEAMRRLALGRVAEALGPAAVELDRALRLMRFGEAVPAMARALPERTRTWAEAFVAGINHHLANATALPYELRLLRLRPEPWTLEHLLTVSRLAAADISWLVFGRLLRGHATLDPATWQALWPLLQQGDTLPVPERAEEAGFGPVRGSNSAAVAASRTANGGGLIASDPHLSLAVPPLWLAVGLHAPGLDVVGLMIPGLPVVALGRNRHVAWGGTNLHAASSELIDVRGETIEGWQETIPVRGRAARTVTLRRTRFGPLVSDGILLRAARPLALRWVGHRPSDEMTAMLEVMRADSLEAVRTALRPFAVPGLTMVAVEAQGRAGRVIAAHLPRRPSAPLAGLVTRPEAAWSLDDLVHAADFPVPEEDIVASANDRPGETPVPVGFFYSLPYRARRLRALMEAASPVDLAALRRMQLDVSDAGALALRDRLLARLPRDRYPDLVQTIAEWDGQYDATSSGALAFQVLIGALARQLVRAPVRAMLGAVWSGRAIIANRLGDAPDEALRRALRRAARAVRRHRDWGGAHRIALRHPLANLPGVGPWFALPHFPAAGSSDTINKTGHGLVTGRHRVTYGACARHLSDLSDPDANEFVLLGGQDGWLGSANAFDQVDLWQEGKTIRVKLRPDGRHRTTLLPR